MCAYCPASNLDVPACGCAAGVLGLMIQPQPADAQLSARSIVCILPVPATALAPVPRSRDPGPCAGRTNVRGGWAAQLAQDAGLKRCLVLRQGVYGWRLDPAVKPYRGYRLQEPPPEAEPFQVEPVNVEAGRVELAQLGIPVL